MTAEQQTTGKPNIASLIFLLSGVSVFLVGMTFSSLLSWHLSLVAQIFLVVFFLVSALLLRGHEHLAKYWKLSYAFFAAGLAILVMSNGSHWTLQTLQVLLSTASGVAFAKFTESVLVVATVLALVRLSGQRPTSVFWSLGNLRSGLTLGLSIFAGFVVLTILKTLGQEIPLQKLVPLIPWIVLFSIANGAMEELLFRGIFLKHCQPVFGANRSNLLTAFVFAVAHMNVSYTPDVAVFLVIVFFLGLGLGHVMQRTNSLIAPVLFHAGADVAFMTEIFISQGVSL